MEYLDYEEQLYLEKTPKSKIQYEIGNESLINGVTSCYQTFNPYPFYIKNAHNVHLIDIDNNKYIDFHGGFGVSFFGYDHPIIKTAHEKIIKTPLITGFPTIDAINVSKKLSKIYNLPMWRYMNSGTEATLDAIRLARARYNRKYIIKIEGGYHGHHDSVWVNVAGNNSNLNRTNIESVPYCDGIPNDIYSLTLIIEVNNIEYLKHITTLYKNEIAGVIIEPVLLNCGIIKVEQEFIDELHKICNENKICIIADLVKLNTQVLAKHWNYIKPDIIVLGKCIAGGFPIGILGMTCEYASLVSNNKVQLAGTLNGNSYVIKMINSILDFITDDILLEVEDKSLYLYNSFNKIIQKYNINAVVEMCGNKGSIFFYKSEYKKPKNYNDYYNYKCDIMETLFVKYMLNRGILIQIRDEWSISLQHTYDHIDKFIFEFESFCKMIHK